MAGGESGQEDETLPQHDNFLKEGFKKLIKKLLTSFKTFDMIMKLFGSQTTRKKMKKLLTNDLIHDKISELLLATDLDN